MFAALCRRQEKFQIAMHEANPTLTTQMVRQSLHQQRRSFTWDEPYLGKLSCTGEAQSKAVRSTESLSISLTSLRFAFKIDGRNNPCRRAQELCRSLVFKCLASDFRDLSLKCFFGKWCSYSEALPKWRAWVQRTPLTLTPLLRPSSSTSRSLTAISCSKEQDTAQFNFYLAGLRAPRQPDPVWTNREGKIHVLGVAAQPQEYPHTLKPPCLSLVLSIQ